MIGPIGRVSWPLGEPRIRAATRLVEAHITQAFLVSLLFLLQGVKGRPSCPHKCKSSYLAVALWFHGNSRLLDFNLIWTYPLGKVGPLLLYIPSTPSHKF